MFKIRSTNSSDLPLIDAGLKSDPDHADRCSPEFWLPAKKAECMVVEDDQGPVLFVRAESVLRLHLQAADVSFRRRGKALDFFEKRITSDASRTPYIQLIFDSVFQPLIRFIRKRGWISSSNEQVKNLD